MTARSCSQNDRAPSGERACSRITSALFKRGAAPLVLAVLSTAALSFGGCTSPDAYLRMPGEGVTGTGDAEPTGGAGSTAQLEAAPLARQGRARAPREERVSVAQQGARPPVQAADPAGFPPAKREQARAPKVARGWARRARAVSGARQGEAVQAARRRAGQRGARPADRAAQGAGTSSLRNRAPAAARPARS